MALPTLEALVGAGYDVVGVVTQPPRPTGRKRVLTETPVAIWAREAGLSVATPEDSKELCAALTQWTPDIAIVVAYGRLLGAQERDLVPGGWWNVHFSLLPRWRGATPVPHAIAAGDTTTGVTLFKIESGVDTGAIALSCEHPIAPHDTTETLLGKLAERAPAMVLDFLTRYRNGDLELTSQQGEGSLAPKPHPDTGVLRWDQLADELYNTVRAWGGEPGCFATRTDTVHRVKIVTAWPSADLAPLSPGDVVVHPEGIAVGTGSIPLVVTRVQPSGKPEMSASDWWRGVPPGVSFRA